MDELEDTSKKTSNRSQFVGLSNFGSTCYLNSMLQMLNAVDSFRNVMLQTGVISPVI